MERENRTPSGSKIARTIFGIFMIIIYVGMGVLLLINFFKWESGPWEWLRWTGGVVLCLYGVWRAYRQFAGIDSRL